MNTASPEEILARPVPEALRPWCAAAGLAARTGGPDCEAVLHDLTNPVHSVVYVVNGHVTGRRPGQSLRHLVKKLLQARDPGDGDLLPDWWFRHGEKLIRSMTLLIRGPSGELVGALCVNQDVSAEEAALGRLGALLPGLAGLALPAPAHGGAWHEPGAPVSPAAQQEAGPHEAAEQGSGETPETSQIELREEMRAELRKALPERAEEGSRSDAPAHEPDRELRPAEGVLEMVFDLIDRMAGEALGAARAEGRSTLTSEARRNLVAFMERRGVFLVKGAIERVAAALSVSRVTLYSDLDKLRKRPAERE